MKPVRVKLLAEVQMTSIDFTNSSEQLHSTHIAQRKRWCTESCQAEQAQQSTQWCNDTIGGNAGTIGAVLAIFAGFCWKSKEGKSKEGKSKEGMNRGQTGQGAGIAMKKENVVISYAEWGATSTSY